MEQLATDQHCGNYLTEFNKESPQWLESGLWLRQPEIITPVLLSSTDDFSSYGFPETHFNMFQESPTYDITTSYLECCHFPNSQATITSESPLDKEHDSLMPQTPKTPKTLEVSKNTIETPARKRKNTDMAKTSSTSNSKSKRHCRSPKVKVATTTMYNNIHPAIDSNGTRLERNRLASNKFRVRKGSEIAQLESEEYNIEALNRQLRGVFNALTTEILTLKMQLLQHTDCNCKLIQAHINTEAQNFVQGLEAVANT